MFHPFCKTSKYWNNFDPKGSVSNETIKLFYNKEGGESETISFFEELIDENLPIYFNSSESVLYIKRYI